MFSGLCGKELGETQLIKEADKVMGKTKMSEPEPPQEVE